MSSFYIPKPCHENWNKMTPQEQGRHCNVCEKVVVDFSKKSHEEITTVINQAAEGSVCGHFHVKQLDQKEQHKVFMNPRNLFNRNWKYFAMSIFGLFLMNKKAAAQGGIKMRGAVAYRPETKTNSRQTILAGVVTNKQDVKLKDAQVVIQSSGREIARLQTDADGFYSAKLEPGKIYNDKVTIIVTHYDYEAKTVNDLTLAKEVVRLNVVMDEYMMIMGKVAPINYEKIKEEELAEAVDSTLKQEIIKTEKSKNETGSPVEKLCVPTNEKQVENSPVVPEKTVTTVVEITENKIIEVIERTGKPPVQKITVKLNTRTAGIYPNPATTYAIVNCSHPDTYNVDVYNAIGGLQQTHAFTGHKLQLDLLTLERGTYFVRVSNNEGVINTLKLVKD